MNERIEELIAQSQKIVGYTDGGYTEVKALDAEKFAELIVLECADICTDPYHKGDAETGTGFGYTTADERCAELIKKHFGVE